MYEQITIPLIDEPESASVTPDRMSEIASPAGSVASSSIAASAPDPPDASGASFVSSTSTVEVIADGSNELSLSPSLAPLSVSSVNVKTRLASVGLSSVFLYSKPSIIDSNWAAVAVIPVRDTVQVVEQPVIW